MTALVIFVSFLAGIAYAASSGTSYLFPGLTIYVAAFIAGLATASLFAVLSRNRRSILGATVLVANFAGSHLAWQTSDPILITAILDLLTAGYFVLAGQTRWELICGFLFIASVGLAIGTWLDLIPDHTERAGGIISPAYPDAVAIAGHIANAILGFGAGDAGKRVGVVFRARPKLVRSLVMVYRMGRERPNAD